MIGFFRKDAQQLSFFQCLYNITILSQALSSPLFTRLRRLIDVVVGGSGRTPLILTRGSVMSFANEMLTKKKNTSP